MSTTVRTGTRALLDSRLLQSGAILDQVRVSFPMISAFMGTAETDPGGVYGELTTRFSRNRYNKENGDKLKVFLSTDLTAGATYARGSAERTAGTLDTTDPFDGYEVEVALYDKGVSIKGSDIEEANGELYLASTSLSNEYAKKMEKQFMKDLNGFLIATGSGVGPSGSVVGSLRHMSSDGRNPRGGVSGAPDDTVYKDYLGVDRATSGGAFLRGKVFDNAGGALNAAAMDAIAASIVPFSMGPSVCFLPSAWYLTAKQSLHTYQRNDKPDTMYILGGGKAQCFEYAGVLWVLDPNLSGFGWVGDVEAVDLHIDLEGTSTSLQKMPYLLARNAYESVLRRRVQLVVTTPSATGILTRYA